MDPFLYLPVEMKLKILRHLRQSDRLTTRLVNSLCKTLISDLIREWPLCILSDATWSTVVNSSEVFHTVKIAKLTGADKVVSSTRGVGQVLSNASELQLLGREIEDAIFPKIAGYLGNISELEFCNTSTATAHAAFKGAITKFVYPNVTTLNLTQTQTCNDCVPRGVSDYANLALPQLQALTIRWTRELDCASRKKIILHVLKLIASLADKLTCLEFLRDERTVDLCRDELTIPQAPFDGLRNLKLQKLKLTTSLGDDAAQGLLRMERMLLQSPHLQELQVENIFTIPEHDEELPNFPTIATLIPAASAATLQRLVIHSSYYDFGIFSLAPFADCRTLKELTLVFYYDRVHRRDHQRDQLSHVEMLPRSLELLRFVPPEEATQRKEFRQRFSCKKASYSEMILSRAQLEWLAAGNLPQLKHLGCLLIVGEERPQREEVNADLAFFKDLVAVNQWTTLQFNLLTAESLREVIDPKTSRIRDTSGLQSYLDFCKSRADIRRMESKLLIDKYVQVSLTKRT